MIQRLGARVSCQAAPFFWAPARSTSAMPPNHGSSIHATSSWGWAGVGFHSDLDNLGTLARPPPRPRAQPRADRGKHQGVRRRTHTVNYHQRHGLAAAVPKVVLSLLVVIVPLIWIGIRWRADRRPPLVETTVGPRAPAITGRNEVLQDPQFWSVAAPFALALDAPRRHVGGRRRDRPRARPGALVQIRTVVRT